MSEITVVKVRKFGVVTIPDSIREALHIEEGDLVRLQVEKIKKVEIKEAEKPAEKNHDVA